MPRPAPHRRLLGEVQGQEPVGPRVEGRGQGRPGVHGTPAPALQGPPHTPPAARREHDAALGRTDTKETIYSLGHREWYGHAAVPPGSNIVQALR